jgi:UDP-glucose:(heptosyl)LPS alpha-1,3-glucosyltransferase
MEQEMQNIAVVRSTFSPYGGEERTAKSVIEGLLEKGVKITLLTCPRQDWKIRHERLSTVVLGTDRGNRLLQAVQFNRAVNRYLNDHFHEIVFSVDKVTRFTHLHAGGGTHRAFLRMKNQTGNIVSRWFRKTSLFHFYRLCLEGEGFQNPMLKKVRCNSELVKEDILAGYDVDPDKLFVLPSSIDWSGMETVFANRKSVAAELGRFHGIDPDGDNLLFLGSGFFRKGLDIVLNGLSKMPESWRLLVVGEGTTAKFMNLAKRLHLGDRVHFLGPQKKGWRYAALCKALALPSRYDPFGGASAEGHAMGLPVLVSSRTGYKERVKDGISGVILEVPATEEAIENAFIRLDKLVKNPKTTPETIREGCRDLDNPVISERLFREFFEI